MRPGTAATVDSKDRQVPLILRERLPPPLATPPLPSAGRSSSSPSAVLHVPEDDHTRTILLLDVDCFYAQSEIVRNPELRGKPVAIQQKYIIVTCNYEARKFGLGKLMRLDQARKMCPGLVVLNGEDLTQYRRDSEAIRAAITQASGPKCVVERGGLDEFYCDITQVVAESSIEAHGVVEPSGRISIHPTGNDWKGAVYSMAGLLWMSHGRTEGPNDTRSIAGAATVAGVCDSASRIVSSGAINRTPCGSCGTTVLFCREAPPTSFYGDARDDNPARPGFVARCAACSHALVKSSCDCGCIDRIRQGSLVASRIQEFVLRTTGFTCSAGVGHSKMASKFAASMRKPLGLTSMPPGLIRPFVARLGVRALPGVGHGLSKQLKALNMETVSHVRRFPVQVLVSQLGPASGELVFRLAWGVDPTEVKDKGPPQTISDEDSFKCCDRLADAEQRIRQLLGKLLARLDLVVEAHRRVPSTFRLAVRHFRKDGTYRSSNRTSRQCPLPQEALSSRSTFARTEGGTARRVDALMPVAMRLFRAVVPSHATPKSFHLTLINVAMTGFSPMSATKRTPLREYFCSASASDSAPASASAPAPAPASASASASPVATVVAERSSGPLAYAALNLASTAPFAKGSPADILQLKSGPGGVPAQPRCMRTGAIPSVSDAQRLKGPLPHLIPPTLPSKHLPSDPCASKRAIGLGGVNGAPTCHANQHGGCTPSVSVRRGPSSPLTSYQTSSERRSTSPESGESPLMPPLPPHPSRSGRKRSQQPVPSEGTPITKPPSPSEAGTGPGRGALPKNQGVPTPTSVDKDLGLVAPKTPRCRLDGGRTGASPVAVLDLTADEPDGSTEVQLARDKSSTTAGVVDSSPSTDRAEFRSQGSELVMKTPLRVSQVDTPSSVSLGPLDPAVLCALPAAVREEVLRAGGAHAAALSAFENTRLDRPEPRPASFLSATVDEDRAPRPSAVRSGVRTGNLTGTCQAASSRTESRARPEPNGPLFRYFRAASPSRGGAKSPEPVGAGVGPWDRGGAHPQEFRLRACLSPGASGGGPRDQKKKVQRRPTQGARTLAESESTASPSVGPGAGLQALIGNSSPRPGGEREGKARRRKRPRV